VHPQIERTHRLLIEALHGLTDVHANAPRTDGKWSIAQIVEHLDLAYTLNSAAMRRRIEKGHLPPKPRNLRQAFARAVVVGLGYFPSGRRGPERTMPQGRPFADVRAGLHQHLTDLDDAFTAAERMFGASAPILDHPFIGPFSVADWRKFHWIHTRHHARQIQERRNLSSSR
jgi:hypothetical protein